MSAAVSAGVLLVGLWVARRYGRRTNVQVEGDVISQGGQPIGVQARVIVRAVGVVRLRPSAGAASKLTLTEVVRTEGQFADGRSWRSRGLFDGEYAEPGETLSTTELFYLKETADDVIGWRLECLFYTDRPVARWGYWVWADRVFIPRSEGSTL